MRKHAFICAFTLASLIAAISPLNAALPPVYQSTKEYRALLDSPKLTEMLGSGEPILSITRKDNGFIVKTNKHWLKVDVVYEPMDHPGPAKFHLEFLQPVEYTE